MSARVCTMAVTAICTVVLTGVAAGFWLAAHGQLVVLHLGGRP